MRSKVEIMKDGICVRAWVLPSVALLCALTGFATVEPTAPVSGAVVPIVPDAQNRVPIPPSMLQKAGITGKNIAGVYAKHIVDTLK